MKSVICLAASIAFLANAEAQYLSKRSVADFNAIEISSAARVNLIQSDSNYVTLSSKDSIKKTPKMDVKDGVLEINSSFRGTMDVHVKNITSIRVSDAARVECKDTLKTDHLTVHVSDAGRADILIHAKYIKLKANDAGSIKFSGSVDSLDIKASDASHVNATALKAGSVRAMSSDGTTVNVWAINSIDANATDGSNVHIKGSPKQKNTSASDGGSIIMDDTGDETTQFNGDHDMHKKGDDSTRGKKSFRISTGDAFIGGGFVTGGTQAGAPVKYGASREFIAGFGWEKKIGKWDGIGMDFYYKSTDFYLNEDSAKTFPNKILHQQEKISVQNFGGLVYDRIHFSRKIFLDGGVYGDWAFHSKYITWDANTSGTESTKTIQRNLSFVNPLDYGLTFRFGYSEGFSVYFNYRLSNLFQNMPASEPTYPQLPVCVVGIDIGGF